MVFHSEKELEKKAVNFFENQNYYFKWQVPVYNRVVDLVALDNEKNVIGVEFKLKDWKRALKQAITNKNSFDYLYICVPGGSYLNSLTEKAQVLGVGVMVYDDDLGTIKIVLDAHKQEKQWKPNLDYLRSYIKQKGNNEL